MSPPLRRYAWQTLGRDSQKANVWNAKTVVRGKVLGADAGWGLKSRGAEGSYLQLQDLVWQSFRAGVCNECGNLGAKCRLCRFSSGRQPQVRAAVAALSGRRPGGGAGLIRPLEIKCQTVHIRDPLVMDAAAQGMYQIPAKPALGQVVDRFAHIRELAFR